MAKKTRYLLILSALFVLIVAQAQADQTKEYAYGTQVSARSNQSTTITIDIPKALDAIITPIIHPSVYEDCNEHPEKYDIWDEKVILETSPCYSNTCWTEQITLHGTSMEPTMMNGDTVSIRHDTEYNLSVGNIIAFDSLGQNKGIYNKNIVHRIIGIEPKNGAKITQTTEGYDVFIETLTGNVSHSWKSDHFLTNLSGELYVTKGDNNNFCEIVPRNAINGILVGVYK